MPYYTLNWFRLPDLQNRIWTRLKLNKDSLNQWTCQFNTAGVCSVTTFCTISRWQRTKEPWQFLPKLGCRWTIILEIWVTETLHSLQSAGVRSQNRKNKVFKKNKKLRGWKISVQLPLCNLYMFQLKHRSCPQEHSKEARKKTKNLSATIKLLYALTALEKNYPPSTTFLSIFCTKF